MGGESVGTVWSRYGRSVTVVWILMNVKSSVVSHLEINLVDNLVNLLQEHSVVHRKVNKLTAGVNQILFHTIPNKSGLD